MAALPNEPPLTPAAPLAPAPLGPTPPLPSGPSGPAVPPLPTSSDDLLWLARHGLAEAEVTAHPAERYAAAHLAALRAAAAVIAARARPAAPTQRVRPLSAWVLLASVAPELGEWAAFFSSGARKRAAAEAGLPGAVTVREADDVLRDAATFLAVVETKLHGVAHPSLLYRSAG